MLSPITAGDADPLKQSKQEEKTKTLCIRYPFSPYLFEIISNDKNMVD